MEEGEHLRYTAGVFRYDPFEPGDESLTIFGISNSFTDVFQMLLITLTRSSQFSRACEHKNPNPGKAHWCVLQLDGIWISHRI